MGKTTGELIEDVENAIIERRLKGKSLEVAEHIMEKAEDGYYHDFLTETAMPKTELALALHVAGLDDLVEKVKQGAYDDESPDDKLPKHDN